MCTYRTICITNRHLVEGDYLTRIREIAAEDAYAIILREKDLPEQDYKLLAQQVLQICEKAGKRCILHHFVKAAMELGHKEIHLSFDAFRNLTREQREYFQVIGVSTHTVEEALICEQLGAAYITASHIFPTKCKEGLAPRGLEYLKEVTEKVSIPVYALGGICSDNAGLCMESGAAGVCMMSAFMEKK